MSGGPLDRLRSVLGHEAVVEAEGIPRVTPATAELRDSGGVNTSFRTEP